MIVKRPRAKRTKEQDTSAFALGALRPARAVEPADARELGATLRAASDAGEAVVLHGGGTLQSAANPP